MCSYVCCDVCQCQRPWHLTWFYQVLNKLMPRDMLFFYLEMHQNAFGGRAMPGTAEEAYSAPQTPSEI